ncbi:Elongation factor Tu domain 2 [Ruminococcus flavefaciens]|uniref:Elongation factor Tu domain 2 n=1 Tax=Ruminococcus flavefaciens TaxID=1265 RepID=A0A1H6L1I8_RUMFL|nr:EF-Tu/IF-2/RF-3 family GTPase [Ruminococcus flavefaciens]SEH78062.1 Elongation factor Tu domain 2 [Ruminococcus flavefaciens]
MGFLDKLKDRIFNREPSDTGFMTDDEKELREYEAYYTPQSGVAEGTYSEFVVTDVFSITGRGTVVTGTVTGGVFFVGDNVLLVHNGDAGTPTTIIGIEQFRKVCESVSEGANAGFILKDIDRKQVSRNDIIKKK